MVWLHVRWTKQQPTRDAVEFDQDNCGGELILGPDEHRTTGELGETALQDRPGPKVLQRGAVVDAPKIAPSKVSRFGEHFIQRRRITFGHFHKPARNRPG